MLTFHLELGGAVINLQYLDESAYLVAETLKAGTLDVCFRWDGTIGEAVAHLNAASIEIIEGLRGHTTGLAVPQLVIDCPDGGGKVPIGPQYLVSWAEDHVVVRNYEGKIYRYPEPKLRNCDCAYDAVWYGPAPR